MSDFMKGVNSLIFPETKQVILSLWNPDTLSLYEKSYEFKQENLHYDFWNLYKDWIKDLVFLPNFSYYYQTNGSSEGIRESLASLDKNKTVHVFEGEYEGYRSFAEAYNIKVVKHKRSNWSNLKLGKNDLFYLSNPSALDGCYWKDFELFVQRMLKFSPETLIRIDLCYIGSTTIDIKINLNYDNIDMIFFSLSKVFGVYYHRIGGVYSREEMLGLTGNKWFKNIFSIQLGINLIKKYAPNELPKKYQNYQKIMVEKLILEKKDLKWTPADVFILVHKKDLLVDEFWRCDDIHRVCLTPGLDKLLNILT